MAGKSKAKGWSSKPLIIGDIVHYVAEMAGDRLTTASAKKEKSLVIKRTKEYILASQNLTLPLCWCRKGLAFR